MDNFTTKLLEDDQVCLKIYDREFVMSRSEIDKVFAAILPFTDRYEARENAEKDAARFRWIIEHPATFAQMARQFAGEALIGLIDNEIQEIRETESEAKPSDFQPGDAVIYIPGHAGGDPNHPDCERGVVSSTNHTNVFVKFGTSETAQSCDPGDLVHAGKGGEDANG